MTRHSHGFTLIETMVAIAIVTIATSGGIFAARQTMVAAWIARDQLTASHLAQEGIEYIRLMRDNAYIAAAETGGPTVSVTAWTNFITGSDAASLTACRTSSCMLDPTRPMGTGSGLSLQPCSGASCIPLYLVGGVYTLQSSAPGAEQTIFTRTIRATDISATDEKITSTVSWNFHGTSHSVSIISHLTPWQ